jgi:hypothetical protein
MTKAWRAIRVVHGHDDGPTVATRMGVPPNGYENTSRPGAFDGGRVRPGASGPLPRSLAPARRCRAAAACTSVLEVAVVGEVLAKTIGRPNSPLAGGGLLGRMAPDFAVDEIGGDVAELAVLVL